MNKSKALIAMTGLCITFAFSNSSPAEESHTENILLSDQKANLENAKLELKQTGVPSTGKQKPLLKNVAAQSSFDELVITFRKDSGDGHLDSQKQNNKLTDVNQ